MVFLLRLACILVYQYINTDPLYRVQSTFVTFALFARELKFDQWVIGTKSDQLLNDDGGVIPNISDKTRRHMNHSDS